MLYWTIDISQSVSPDKDKNVRPHAKSRQINIFLNERRLLICYWILCDINNSAGPR